jgi:TRAP transporter 4TM/12TM fusion protein
MAEINTELDVEAAENFEGHYDPEMQFRHTSGAGRWTMVALLFSLSMFHYYTAGFGVLEHHWHVGVHLAFVLGLIFLVYTAHRSTGQAGTVAAPELRPQVHWPDAVKCAAAALFLGGMFGSVIGIGVGVGFLALVHFSRQRAAERGEPALDVTDHVFAAVLALFCLIAVGQYSGFIGANLWGKAFPPPAPITLNMAMMMMTLVFEAKRRIPVLVVLFAAGVYYFGGGVGGITAGIESQGAGITAATSIVVLLIALEPVIRKISSLSPEDRKLADEKRHGGVPAYDWFLFTLVAVASMYVAITYDGYNSIFGKLDELNFRIGDPARLDLLLGTAMVILVVEAARRTSGLALPIITIIFVIYGLFGPYFSYPLVHPGTAWPGLIDHLYLKGEGVNGRPVFVVATYVFHFVLFGMIAIRVGLGQLFIDIAHCIAGKYAGGPAKVSVLASGMMGMISGSSIANTVMTGSLTIPNMKRVGYQAHFAGAVEAAASTGGQITPPIMGSAAFLMVEFLEIPLPDIILAAVIPASMHYLGVLMMVHFEAKRLGLRGLRPDELPVLAKVLARRWLTVLPFILIIYMIFVGHTPYWAAFWSISACLAMGFGNRFIRWLLLTTRGIPEEVSGRYLGCDPVGIREFIDAFQMGAKYALSVGAAAATVGIIIGVLTVTGTPFNIAAMVTTFAGDVGGFVVALDPMGWLTVEQATRFITLILVALSCIVMGAGLPTTATYLVLATMATPALAILGVEALQTHFFVFYYGVLADITPPVALAAYAGATIAQSDLMQTGNTAFKLGAAKALVPFVFIYAPSMLFVIDGFSWEQFLIATIGCAIGVVMIGAALTGYLLHPMAGWHRLLMGFGALFVIAPGIESGVIGLAIASPVLLLQFFGWRRRNASLAGSETVDSTEPWD